MMIVVISKHYHAKMYYLQYSQYNRIDRDVDSMAMPGSLPAPMKIPTTKSLANEMAISGETMTMGSGTFIAAASGIFSMIAGIIMICTGCGSNDDDDSEYEYDQSIVREDTRL